jgi:hypothetical protein
LSQSEKLSEVNPPLTQSVKQCNEATLQTGLELALLIQSIESTRDHCSDVAAKNSILLPMI